LFICAKTLLVETNAPQARHLPMLPPPAKPPKSEASEKPPDVPVLTPPAVAVTDLAAQDESQ
jgi:hypothetical protein